MTLNKSTQPSKGLKVGLHHGPKLKEFNKEKLDDIYNEAKRKTTKMYAEGKKSVRKVPKKVKKHTKELIKNLEKKPLTFMLVAGGIGLLMGLLLMNKNK